MVISKLLVKICLHPSVFIWPTSKIPSSWLWAIHPRRTPTTGIRVVAAQRWNALVVPAAVSMETRVTTSISSNIGDTWLTKWTSLTAAISWWWILSLRAQPIYPRHPKDTIIAVAANLLSSLSLMKAATLTNNLWSLKRKRRDSRYLWKVAPQKPT